MAADVAGLGIDGGEQRLMRTEIQGKPAFLGIPAKPK